MRAKLIVHRDSHKRKSVKVKGSTFEIKDRGKLGRTPKSQQFFRPKVHTGWKADMPASKRRGLVLKAHKREFLASARSMQALSNIQHRINPDVAAKAKADADYFLSLIHI